MPEVIRGREVVQDDWTVVRPEAGAVLSDVSLPDGPIVVPLALWTARQDELSARSGVGVWLAPADEPELLLPFIGSLALVAIDFPRFTDGRGYSTAYLLRTRYGYRGELRAIGDVLPDQVFYMARVGFDSFALRPDRKAEHALKALAAFSDAYQGSWDEPLPAFRRAARPQADLTRGEGQVAA